MTFFDRFLQRRRIKRAIHFIPPGSVVLDIGCHYGELFLALGSKLKYGIGIDPVLKENIVHEKYELIKDVFPSPQVINKLYHCVVMLAVLEHITPDQQPTVIDTCHKLLHKEGLIILTIPDERVDKILFILQKFGLIEGMKLKEHYGFEVRRTIPLFTRAGFELTIHKKFQFGFNNLFVFKKSLS